MIAPPRGILAPALAGLIAHPGLAVTLVLCGILLLYVEFNRPGKVVFAALGIFSATLGGYALLQHPIDPLAVIALPLGIALSVLGLFLHHGYLLQAVSMLTLTWALDHLLLRQPAGDAATIHLATAFTVSAAFVVITTWLGGFAVQARRNKRLPIRKVQSPPHTAARASRIDW